MRIGTMGFMRSTLLVLLTLAACAAPLPDLLDEAGVADASFDAALEDAETEDSGPEDAALDASADGSSDAELDATADAGTDAGDESDLPWPFYMEGDECDMLAQDCPFVTHTCRRERSSGAWGAARCLPFGTLLEGNPTPCNDDPLDWYCAKGLFCLVGGECHRACDPSGAACPNTSHGNAPQTCVSRSDYPQPYCTAFP